MYQVSKTIAEDLESSASDITAINDNVRTDRSQLFGYDALSRLTSADGSYGSIQYGYNGGGDRTSRDWSRADGTLSSESYTYDAATARLMGVSLDDGAGNMSPLRDFSYNASGQLVADTRTSYASENIYSYGINARGRMTTVSLGGVEIASYTYDESEQRIVKAANGNTTHYHYDLEGRLIAETDGVTGETLREYVWLGLMPIAVIAPTEVAPEGECNPALIKALEAELATATAAADALQSQILDWDGNIAFREAKIAEMREQLDSLSGKKREKLEDKIAKWESLIASTEAKVTEAETELAAINTQIADIDTALAEQQAICGGTTPTLGTGTFYLHADHLGRPQFATDSDGAIVWDMGDQVTPFGQGVNLAGAFAQKLMFPGQYADEETGEEITLSHNWHRTYDPTLGRYLQSDPIGLAGGLNRYVYGLGDPVSNIDPDGRIVPILIGIGAGILLDYALDKVEEKFCKCENDFPDASTAIAGSLGAAAGYFGGFAKKPRTGAAGGGKSGNKTSLFSKNLHNANQKGYIDQKTTRNLRKVGRILAKVTGPLAIGFTVVRIYKISECF